MNFYERIAKLKKKGKKVKKVTEVGKAETETEAGAYSGGAKPPASRAGRATDGGDQTPQERENRRKEQQADIERSTGLTASKKSKLNKESFYERMGDLLNELAVNASKKKKKKGKKKVDDDAVSTTLKQQKTDATTTDAEDEEEAETGQAVEAKKGDKDWIQKAVNPKHKGYCTPMTKATCTPKRKALAKTFKKMGRKKDKAITAKDEK